MDSDTIAVLQDKEIVMRLIDADAFVKYLENEIRLMEEDGASPYALMIASGAINDVGRQPTIEPKRGEWVEADVVGIEDTCIEEIQTLKCSVCGRIQTKPYMYYVDCDNFCPNCGADMREREGE